ncbi:TetR/AcrR family transcriptional regulator [Streptomyces sp. NPDC002402]
MSSPHRRAGTKGVPRERRKQDILGAATEEFGRRGYEAASLAAIAQQVGVTKTLLHQYFGTKQDLYIACLTPIGERLLSAIRTAMTGSRSTADVPLAVLHAVFTALEGSREAWLVLYDNRLPPDSEAARLAKEYRVGIDALAAAGSAEILRAARLTDPLDADALKYAWRGLVTALVNWWIRHPEQSPQAMAERCARLFTSAGMAFGTAHTPGS